MTEDDKIICDGCKKEIKGTTEKPANVWASPSDDGSKMLDLCDHCNKYYCNDCGENLFDEPEKNIKEIDDCYYHLDCNPIDYFEG